MKRALIVLLLIFNYSCKKEVKNTLELTNNNYSEKQKDTLNSENLNDSLVRENKNEKQIDSSANNAEFNFDYVKSKTKKLSREIHVSYNPTKNSKKFIPREFLSKHISNHKIDIGFPDYLSAEYPESYSFEEFKEFKDFDLFTFTHDDESCCTTLYAATTKKDTLDIISISVIGYTGGDGGWNGAKYGTWIKQNLISNLEYSFSQELFAEPNETPQTEIDTIWSEIKLLTNGKMEYRELKKVKYIDSTRVE